MTVVVHMPEVEYVIEIILKEGFKVKCHESIHGASLAEILSKLPLAVVEIQRKEHELALAKLADDDIPF